MKKLTINSHAAFESYIGKELGVSEFLQITQERINLFAEATLDHQWIHTDPKKAQKGPFGKTIAHGYLTLSIIPYLWGQVVEFNHVKMLVNYGIESLRFGEPVRVDDEVRLRVKLESLTNLRGISKTVLNVALEIRDREKTAFNGRLILLYHFEQTQV